MPHIQSSAAPSSRMRQYASDEAKIGGGGINLFTWLLAVIILEYATYLVRSNVSDKSIKIAALSILLCAFPYRHVPHSFRVTILLYMSLLAASVLPSMFTFDVVGLAQATKLALQFVVLPAILFRLSGEQAPPLKLVRLPIIWAVLFAMQATVLFVLVFGNLEPAPSIVRVERLDNMPEMDFGLLGYGNTYTVYETHYRSIRPQGWFLEPSNLAGFLVYPAFVSWGIYRNRRKLHYLFASLICFAGIALAFSLAGYMAVLGAVLSLVILRPAKGRSSRTTFARRYIGPIILGALFLLIANALLKRLYQIPQIAGGPRILGLLSRNPATDKLFRTYWRFSTVVAILSRNPFGVGLAHTAFQSETTSANPLMFWAASGGILAIIILVCLYWQLFYRYALPCYISRNPIAQSIAAAFVAATIQGFSYGTWISPSYLFAVAMLMLYGHHMTVAPFDVARGVTEASKMGGRRGLLRLVSRPAIS